MRGGPNSCEFSYGKIVVATVQLRCYRFSADGLGGTTFGRLAIGKPL